MPAISQQKPFVVPVFIPHAGCPHRCLFCDQTQTTGAGEQIPDARQLHAIIDRFLGYRRNPRRYTEISFFGGNFLGLATGQVEFLLHSAADYVSRGVVNGLRFSTRPDTITSKSLACIANFPVSTVEIGVQSMNDTVLKACRRGHTAEQTRRAAEALKRTGCRLGLQMMVGLPSDTHEQAMDTARDIAALQPDFVRIYPTLVLKGSILAQWHAQGRYAPLSLEAGVAVVKDLLAYFTLKGITVARMGLQPTADLNPQSGVVAGPFHPAFGELVHSAWWLAALKQWLGREDVITESIEITSHPSMLSRIKGHKNENILHLSRQFGASCVKVSTDCLLPAHSVIINGRKFSLLSNDEFA